MTIEEAIKRLTTYGVEKDLIKESDRIFITNRLLEELQIDDWEEPAQTYKNVELLPALECITDYAVKKGLTKGDGITARDLFDTKIMGILTPRPSEVIARFEALYRESPVRATDAFYRLATDSNYIRADRIKKDMKWVTPTKYGDLDITINLSKPEKDPKAIAAAKNAPQSGYPKCQLCRENIGYAGRLNHPARQNLRAVPLRINRSDWMMQYSPYVYYNEHCIVFNCRHTPMSIVPETFGKLLDFIKQFKHYFDGSKADLPIAGGSILSHDHFQGGHYVFPMEKAEIEVPFIFKGYEDIEAGIVRWPMSCLRLRSTSRKKLIALATEVLGAWRGYSDPSRCIFAYSGEVPHNTITPIARYKKGKYELDLVLRNNITTEKHPLGLYHPHADKHHIKKENIGLIEVMGLAVLPARLKKELKELEDYLVKGQSPYSSEELKKHAPWCDEILTKYPQIDADNVSEILKYEVGQVFAGVLEDAGVYKCDADGRAGFLRFLESAVDR